VICERALVCAKIIQSHGPLAQLVEHLICNERVAGSNPVRSTNATAERRFFVCGP
jgi:hypothetical protein